MAKALLWFLFLLFCFCTVISEAEDGRNIRNGFVLPTENYADQPYLVKTNDGAWLCIVTTGAGAEGKSGQHVVTLRSTDQGKTWTAPVDVEPATGPEASYAVLLKVPSGRIYAFYNHNTDNIRQVIADNPPYKNGFCQRVDSLGDYVFKYSDDDGRTWPDRRYAIPVREMAIDRENPYAGKIRFFWNVGKPFISQGKVYVPLCKVGGFGQGFFTRNEGVLLCSANMLMESDPQKITWETLPDGDHGLRTPPGGGPISAEHSYVVLSDHSFFCVYRTVDGHPVYTYSRDGGHTWDPPAYMHFADGRLMKHPRAANFVWKCSNGKYLYWFHNHGGRGYEDRNPAWLCGGIETDSPQGKIIQWSQPEIVLYDDDPMIRISYPDLLEDNGNFYLTETQKNIARVHPLDSKLLQGLWDQFNPASVSLEGVILDLPVHQNPIPHEVKMPRLPSFLARDTQRADYGTKDLRQEFAIEAWVQFQSLRAGQILMDNRDSTGKGFCVRTTSRRSLDIVLNDGRSESRWECDPGLLDENTRHHIVISVDGGPKIILFIIDGQLCDGGESRQFGWGRFNPNLRDVNGEKTLRIAPDFEGTLYQLRLYNRCLPVSEAVNHYQAGCDFTMPLRIHKSNR